MKVTRGRHATPLPQQWHVTVHHKCLSANKQTDETIGFSGSELEEKEKNQLIQSSLSSGSLKSPAGPALESSHASCLRDTEWIQRCSRPRRNREKGNGLYLVATAARAESRRRHYYDY